MNENEFKRLWSNAKSLRRSGKYEESIDIYRSLVPLLDEMANTFKREPGSSDARFEKLIHFEKAMFWGDFIAPLCENGQFEEALVASKNALLHKDAGGFPTLLYILYNTGNIFLASQHYEEAISWYDKALFENENNRIWLNENERADYYTNKGIALYFLKQHEEAEQWFLKAIHVVQNYRNFEPYFFLGSLYERKGETKLQTKYHKMFLTRKAKMSAVEFQSRTRFYPTDFGF